MLFFLWGRSLSVPHTFGDEAENHTGSRTLVRLRNPHAKFAKSAKCRHHKIRIIADCFFVFYVFFVIKILWRLTQSRSSRSEGSGDFWKLPRFLLRTYVRDQKKVGFVGRGNGGALFHWQARTPAVDEDVDPPKRIRRSLRQLLIAH